MARSVAVARNPLAFERCMEHGLAAFCYLQGDGSHVDGNDCRCDEIAGRPHPECPVEAHARAGQAIGIKVNGQLRML